jgi:hypothetical protein
MINVNIEDDGSITGVNMSNFGISGFGFGVDLGAVYTPAALPELTVSLALNDIGFNSWSNMNKYVTQENFVFEGFNKIGSTETGSLEEQLNDIVDDMGELIHIEETKPTTHTQSLRTTLNVGAEFNVLDNHIGFGVLSHTEFRPLYISSELTASVNFRPSNWFTATLSHTFCNRNAPGIFGFALNLHPRGLNLFVGMDYIDTTFVRYSTSVVPKRLKSFNTYFGLGFNL